MSSERNSLLLFAFAATMAILVTFVTTLGRIGTRMADNQTPPGTTGLARPHPPLDRAPGQALLRK